MEIPELNLLSYFDSHIFPISTFSKVPKILSLCKWGAIILAVLIVARIKLLILKFCRIQFLPSSVVDSIKILNDDDFEFDDEELDDTCSSVSLDEDDDTIEYEERESSSENETECCFGRRFSWSDFSPGNSVVTLWDNFTAGFEHKDETDLNPAVEILSEKANNRVFLFGLYDSRVSKGSPELTAEWPELRRRSVTGKFSGSDEKVYIRDDLTGELTIGDLRNVKSPLVYPNGVIGVNYY